MKVYAHKDETGWLFLPEWYDTPETFLTHFSAQEISDMEFAQAHDVWPGVETMLSDCYSYTDGCIIEGVNITPEILHKHLNWREDILPIFIVDDNKERIREVVYTRGLFSDANKYSDDLKEKEVEWVQLFIEKLKQDCKTYDFPCMGIEKNENDVNNILPIVKDHFKL